MTGSLTFSEVTLDDLEDLVAIRVTAMRESLERLGRFDPGRARARLVNGFIREYCRSFEIDGERVGFYVLRPTDDGLWLDHLYIRPDRQGKGFGGQVMRHLIELAGQKCSAIHLGALKESAANTFYRRHGFVLVREDEWDNYYTRPA